MLLIHYDDFVSLWDFTMPDGPMNKLVILHHNFQMIQIQGRYGNQVHLYYPSIYQNIPGLKRDISGDENFPE